MIIWGISELKIITCYSVFRSKISIHIIFKYNCGTPTLYQLIINKPKTNSKEKSTLNYDLIILPETDSNKL